MKIDNNKYYTILILNKFNNMGNDITQEYIRKADNIINEFVTFHKDRNIKSLYNAYNAVIDESKYKYIEDTYGLGNAQSIEFIPLIKKHIDVLLGEYLSYAKIANVGCKDNTTLNNIYRDKKLHIDKAISDELTKKIHNGLYKVLHGKEDTDINIEKELIELKETLNDDFISEYEITSQNIVDYILTSREVDLSTKLRTLAFDVLVTGQNYFISKPNASDEDVEIEVINPEDAYVKFNPNSNYVKDCTKAVIKRVLPVNDILVKYHDKLSKEDKERISNYINIDGYKPNSIIYFDDFTDYKKDYLTTYEVQWIEVDKDGYMQRYEVTRIASDIYIITGKVENPMRSSSNPKKCTLTLNGVYFLNRNNKPYSMVETCLPLQEKYNLLHFYRDNLIAQSGTKGNWLDLSLLPTFLGNTAEERVIAFKSYLKQGLGLIDTSQEGRSSENPGMLNTIFSGFDNSLNAGSIQGIHYALENIEQTMSSITGVFRERMGGIEQRDAVTNVKLSVNNSHTITRHYYDQFDKILSEILLDSLNVCKHTYRNGLRGSIILGDKKAKIFTALPEHFTLSDQDIRVSSTSDIIKEIAEIKNNVPMLIQGGLIDSEILLEIMSTRSLTELKLKIKKSMAKKKEENNQLQQLAQENQRLKEQFKQLEEALKEAQHKLQKYSQEELKLEKEKQDNRFKVDWFNAETNRTFREKRIEIEKERNNLEYMQQFDDNPYNDTIRKS